MKQIACQARIFAQNNDAYQYIGFLGTGNGDIRATKEVVRSQDPLTCAEVKVASFEFATFQGGANTQAC